MASPKPAVIVRREFEATPDVVSQQLRACIIGPACQLVRFGKTDEKSKGFISTLSTLGVDSATSPKLLSAATLYSIPNVEAGAVIDASFSKLFIEDAYLNYASILTSYTRPTLNSIKGPNWKASLGNTRAVQLPQDVAVGDIVTFYTKGATEVTKLHQSTVTGFIADAPASSYGAVTNAYQVSAGTTTAGVTGSTTWGPSLTETVPYLSTDAHQVADPRRVGSKTTVYTVTVTGKGETTVDFTVTSSTGLDDAAFSAKAQGDKVVMTSGLALVVPAIGGLSVGGTSQFTVTVGHTQTPTPTSPTGYNGLQSTVYVLTCTQGGSLKTGVTFRVTTTNGYDAPSTSTIEVDGANVTAILGSYGFRLTFASVANYATGFLKGDVIQVAVTVTSTGAISTLVFADSYDGTIDLVRVSKKRNIEVPKFSPDGASLNWQVKNPTDAVLRQLEVGSAGGRVVVRDSSVPGVDCAVIAGKVHLQYRAFKALPREVGAVNTLSDITTQLGIVDPDNLLAYAVYKAWTTANGVTVHFIPTLSDTLNGTRGFADAISVAKGVRNCYSLVPLTNDPAVWQAFVGHVQQQSAPEIGNFRLLWIAPEIPSHFPILASDPSGQLLTGSTGTYDPTSGTLDFNSPAGLTPKFTETVLPGDWIRTNFVPGPDGTETFSEFRVVSVLDNDTVNIAVPVGTVVVTLSKFQVYRDLTSQALAQKYAQVAGGFSSERVFAVVTDRGIDGLKAGGVSVKNWNVAAAFAGLRSGSRPQQPLSNVELLGFDGVNTNIPIFNDDDMSILRDGGMWVVRNTEDGKIYVERQLSTSTLDLYRKEQSVTANVDSIAFTLGDSLRDLVGRVNINDNNVAVLTNRLISVLSSLSSDGGLISVGPQIAAYQIQSITIPATSQDTIKAAVSLTVPLPMNTIDVTLVV
jgi:hypothetical protein